MAARRYQISMISRVRVANEWNVFQHEKRNFVPLKAMLHEAIFRATCNATMTNKKPFKLQRGCYTQATCLATLQKVEGRSTFLATRNATIAVAKWGVTREFFLATCNATNVALQVARKIASCNMALSDDVVFFLSYKILAVQQKMFYSFYFKNWGLNLTT